MISFLLKGLLRDRSRSLFPLLTVFAGVVLTVILHAWMHGAISTVIQSTAHYSTGHVRVMTRAYAKEADQLPNDLALLGVDSVLAGLRRDFPDILWTPRIRFGGMLDVPDEHKETRAQVPVSGIAGDLLSDGSPELRMLNIRQAIVQGRPPRRHGEILLGDELAGKLRLRMGDTVTLMSSTMYGSMSLANFAVVGTVTFGISAMDKGTVIADVADIRQALDMQDGAGELLGLFADDVYHEDRADAAAAAFNAGHADPDQFSPVMGTLLGQSGLAEYLGLVETYIGIIIAVFTFAMSIVLWNAGLTGSLRRYGEIGVRLALGEDKTHVYLSLLTESLAIGVIGSVIGTCAGLALAYYMQVHGIDVGAILSSSTMMLPNVLRARILPSTFVIGFLPGVLATFLGTAISGVGIYRRQTSELFKELGT